jgi:MATE family multidrug resistance protein
VKTDFWEEAGGLLRLAGPLVVSHVATIGMTTVDTLMVAPLGPVPLASMAAAVAVHVFLIMVGTGIVLGMTPLVSQAEGASDRPEARRVLIQGLWLASLVSIPLVGVSLFGPWLARLLGQEPAVADLAGRYLVALAPGIIPLMLFTALRQFIEGLGFTKPSMVFLLSGLGLNVLADWALIYGVADVIPAMGALGSAWATSAVRGALLVAMGVYLARHPDLRPFADVSHRPRLRRMAHIARIGAPIGGQIGLEVGVFSFAALMMGWFGASALAAHQVTINLAATTFMVALGASLAGTIRVGQHVGARREHRVRLAAASTYMLAIGFMAVFAAAFLILPDWLVGLYTDDPEVVGIATGLLLVAALFQVFDGAQVAGMCVLRGVADTRIPMLIAAFSYWGVGAPVGWLLAFPLGVGPAGVWIGLSIGLALAAGALLVRVRHSLWRSDLPGRAGA